MLHLNYDGNQNNGIIFNDKYSNGALFIGAEFKPKLSFEYFGFEYSEAFNSRPNIVINIDKTQRVMTDDECIEIKDIANNWIQPLGQEGNPTDTQKQDALNTEVKTTLALGDWEVIRELERMFLKDTPINIAREQLRQSIA